MVICLLNIEKFGVIRIYFSYEFVVIEKRVESIFEFVVNIGILFILG